MPSIWDWSTTAANNANADSGINWAEGQAPSTVNNSARVVMARVRELLNDLGGVSVAGGTASAITVSASSAFTAYADGIRLSFRASNTNTGGTTLNANAVGAKPIVKMAVTGETTLAGGEIQDDGIYEVVYSTILNGAAGAWLLLNPSNTDVIPPGIIAPFGGTSIPSGWLSCNGAAVSRSTYARLFSAIGTLWGIGDGSTTFNVPSLQNEFLRGASTTLAVGTKQSDTIKRHTHTGTTSSDGDHTHNVDISVDNGDTRAIGGAGSGGSFTTSSSGDHTHTFTTDATGDEETRPRNAVVLWIIKY